LASGKLIDLTNTQQTSDLLFIIDNDLLFITDTSDLLGIIDIDIIINIDIYFEFIFDLTSNLHRNFVDIITNGGRHGCQVPRP
jgi:hypothetical protein